MAEIITASTVTDAADGDAAATTQAGEGVRPAGAAGAVWDALKAAPGGTTVTGLASAAGVSRASVSKALNGFADAGRAVRTPGTGTAPALWAPAAPTTDATTGATTDDPTGEAAGTAGDAGSAVIDGVDGTVGNGAAGGVSSEALAAAVRLLSDEGGRRAAAAEALARAQAEEVARRAQVDAELDRARRREAARAMLADLLVAVTTTLSAVAADDQDAMSGGLEKIAEYAGVVRRASRTASTGTARIGPAAGGVGAGDRAAPSPLRPLVEAHLLAYAGKDFTPGEVARVLGRSPGAVANALDTLTGHGVTILTCDKPRRYRAASPTPDINATDTADVATTTTGVTGAA